MDEIIDKETKLWHTKNSLLDIISIRMIVSEMTVICIPDLKIEEGKLLVIVKLGRNQDVT